MNDRDAIEQLRAELRQDFAFIEINYRKNREMTARIAAAKTEDEFQYAALGYTLHNLYNAFESYFLRIAKFFENNLDEAAWHRSLVERMTLDIEGVRPALFDLTLASRIDELMRFRHFFRNVYKSFLIPEKVRIVNRAAENVVDEFSACHECFDAFLKKLKSELA